MLGFQPLCVAPLGAEGPVVDIDQYDLQSIFLFGLDTRAIAIDGFDFRAVSLLGVDLRTALLPTGQEDVDLPTISEIYVDDNDIGYEDENSNIYLSNDTD